MMRRQHEVLVTTSERDNLPMTCWCFEKAHSVVQSLARVAERTSVHDDERCAAELQYALYDATKLWAMFAGNLDRWHTSDAELVLKEGIEGYEKLRLRYEGPDLRLV